MRVLFVDEKSWIKKVPYTIHYLAEQLVARGHAVFAIDYDDTWQRTSRADLWSPQTHQRVAKINPTCTIDLTTPGFIKFAGLSRISTLITHTVAIARVLRQERIDVIVTYSLTNALPTILLGRLLGIPVFFHSIDMLAPLVPHPLLARPAEWIEQLLIRGADCVLALTPVFAKRAARLGARRTAIIPNGVAIARLTPGLDTTALRKELGLENQRVIAFVGTFTRHVGLIPLLEAFAQMTWPDVKLLLVGDDIVTAGHERRVAETRCQELGIQEQVIFTGLQPANRVPLYINLADVCISPFPPSTFSRYNIAMKVFEYMACARPTVSFALEGTQSLVPEGAGGVVYVQSHAELMQAIRRLLDTPNECEALGTAGRKLVEECFTWERVGADLEQVLLESLQNTEININIEAVKQ